MLWKLELIEQRRIELIEQYLGHLTNWTLTIFEKYYSSITELNRILIGGLGSIKRAWFKELDGLTILKIWVVDLLGQCEHFRSFPSTDRQSCCEHVEW